MSFKSRRQLRFEGLESRMLLTANVAAFVDTPAPSPHGHDNIQACFADDVLQGGDYLGAGTVKSAHAQKDFWPDQIPLPTGFEPEGIELGKGQDFFVGGFSYSSFFGPRFGVDHPVSEFAGAIYKGNLRTGEGRILVQPPPEDEAFLISGLSYDVRTDYLYAATADPGPYGGEYPNQGVSIYNGTTGTLVDRIIFGSGIAINDVLVTNKAVYFTDSLHADLYKVPLANGGQPSSVWEKIEMEGFEMVPGSFNANGLVGDFNGKDLVVVNIKSGDLYHVDTESGAASLIDIQGDEEAFPKGDGLYLQGRTLYIMQNSVEKIAVVQLSDDLREGTFVKNIESTDFSVPTSIIGHGDSIYALNSQFAAAVFGDPTQVQSQVVKVHK